MNHPTKRCERRGCEVRAGDKVYIFDLATTAQQFERDITAAGVAPQEPPGGCIRIADHFSPDSLKDKLAREKAIRDAEVQKMRGKARAKDRRINGSR